VACGRADAGGHGFIGEGHRLPRGLTDVEGVDFLGEKLPTATPRVLSLRKKAASMPIAPRASAAGAEGEAGFLADLFEGSVAAIVEDEVGRGVVGDDEVDVAVAVEIDRATARLLAMVRPFAVTRMPAGRLMSVKVPSPLL